MRVEVILTSKLRGGIAVLEHLMERLDQISTTTATLLGTLSEAIECFVVADISD